MPRRSHTEVRGTGATVRVVEGRYGDVGVLRLEGAVSDPGTMVHLARSLLDAGIDGGHLVLDLDGLRVVDPSALCALLARLAVATGGVPIPTAVSDAGTRRLLRACGAGAAGLACFPGVAEAAAVARPLVGN
jgi:hypothetical protein